MNTTANTTISNSRTQDSAAKIIFGNNKLCSEFLRDYSGIEVLKEVSEEDIEDMTTRYIPMFTEERDSDGELIERNDEISFVMLIDRMKSLAHPAQQNKRCCLYDQDNGDTDAE